MSRHTTLQLSGLDDTRRVRRDGHVIVYGVRLDDRLRRIVGVALTDHDARDVMKAAQQEGTLPQIEVDDKHWFYVAFFGAGETVWIGGDNETKK